MLIYLKVHYGCSSKAEVLRKAIALLHIAMIAEKEGAKLMVVGKEYTKEIIVC